MKDSFRWHILPRATRQRLKTGCYRLSQRPERAICTTLQAFKIDVGGECYQ